MDTSDVEAILTKEKIVALLSGGCSVCQRICEEDKDSLGPDADMGQFYDCPKRHRVCMNCLHSHVARTKPKGNLQFPYPIYHCAECGCDCEFTALRVHDEHYFDLFSVVRQFLACPSDKLFSKETNKCTLGCMDPQCKAKDARYSRAFVYLVEGYLNTIEVNVEGGKLPSAEELKCVNDWLYKYYAETSVSPEGKVMLRVYTYNLSKIPPIVLRKEKREKDDYMIINFQNLIMMATEFAANKVNYFPGWEPAFNDPSRLRKMDKAEPGYNEVLSLLRKCCAGKGPKGDPEAYVIQNGKLWQLYASARGKAPVAGEKLLALLGEEHIEPSKVMATETGLLELMAKQREIGRTVLLTESGAAHAKAFRRGDGKRELVLARTVIGEKGPDKPGKNTTSMPCKKDESFVRFGNYEYDEGGDKVYAVYNLAQLYPAYIMVYDI